MVTIILGVIGCFILVGSLGLLLIAVNAFILFKMHKCSHCGSYMQYRGLKDDNDSGHFLFHCPKCGAWQSIPKEEFLRNNEKEYDPTKQ